MVKVNGNRGDEYTCLPAAVSTFGGPAVSKQPWLRLGFRSTDFVEIYFNENNNEEST